MSDDVMLDEPLFVGCVKNEGEFGVLGPFFNLSHAKQEARGEGFGGAYSDCENAHLIGRSVGPNIYVAPPNISDAMRGPYLERLLAWQEARRASCGATATEGDPQPGGSATKENER